MLPVIEGVLFLDNNDGSRLCAKFYGGGWGSQEDKTAFEGKLFKKVQSTALRSEAQVCLVEGKCVVYEISQTHDVIVAIVGGEDENELILLDVLQALFSAVGALLKYNLDKVTIVDNIELVLLSIDELVDGGIIVETDAGAIEGRVLMRGAVPEATSSYSEMSVSAVLASARDKIASSFLK